MSTTHEAMVELIVATLDAVDGAGSDLEVGRRDGEWLAVHGNLDVHHLASDVLAAMEPRVITTEEELDALSEVSVIHDSQGDVGTILNGRIWYPETAPLARRMSRRYLPATVLYEAKA